MKKQSFVVCAKGISDEMAKNKLVVYLSQLWDKKHAGLDYPRTIEEKCKFLIDKEDENRDSLPKSLMFACGLFGFIWVTLVIWSGFRGHFYLERVVRDWIFWAGIISGVSSLVCGGMIIARARKKEAEMSDYDEVGIEVEKFSQLVSKVMRMGGVKPLVGIPYIYKVLDDLALEIVGLEHLRRPDGETMKVLTVNGQTQTYSLKELKKAFEAMLDTLAEIGVLQDADPGPWYRRAEHEIAGLAKFSVKL